PAWHFSPACCRLVHPAKPPNRPSLTPPPRPSAISSNGGRKASMPVNASTNATMAIRPPASRQRAFPAALVLCLQDLRQAALDPVRQRPNLLCGLPTQRCQPVFHVRWHHVM